MNKNAEFPQNFSMQDAMRLANTPAGQQLIKLLQQQGGADFQSAMSSAAQGNYDQAKKALSALMDSPEIMALLNQLGGKL